MYEQYEYQKERMRDLQREADTYRLVKRMRTNTHKTDHRLNQYLSHVTFWLNSSRKAARLRIKPSTRHSIQGMEV